MKFKAKGGYSLFRVLLASIALLFMCFVVLHHYSTQNILLLEDGSILGECLSPQATYDDLALAPPSKFLIYVINHDDASEKKARVWCACRSAWCRPLRIPNTPFFESIVYELLLEPKRLENWLHHSNVVGIVTYKSITMFSLEKLQMALTLVEVGAYDVVPLMNYSKRLFKQAVRGHGEKIQQVLKQTLGALSFPDQRIRGLENTEVFLRNSLILSPSSLLGLAKFMSQAMSIAQADEKLSLALKGDSKYCCGSKKVALRAFNTSYYQWHPFVFERLPSLFLAYQNISVFSALREQGREPRAQEEELEDHENWQV